MRILHITDELGSPASGITSYLEGLLPLLESAKVRVSVYSPDRTTGGTLGKFTLGNTGEGAGSVGLLNGFLSRWASPRYYRKVADLLEQERPSLLHAHSVSLRLSPLVLRAAREASIPVVMTVHDFNYVCPRKWLQRTAAQVCTDGFDFACLVRNCPTIRGGWLYLPYQDARWLKIAVHRRMLRRWVHLFVCPTEILSGYMRRAFPASSVACLPNFVTPFGTLPAAWTIPNQILFVGRLSKDKGVDVLLEAMPAILAACPDTRLTVVGDGPERQALVALAKRLNVSGCVVFCGLVEHSRIREYYGSSTVCVLPSSWMENCPISALEALAARRPIVATAIGGLPEVVEDGVTGFLVRVGDSRELAARIVRLLSDSRLVQLFADQAGRAFEQRFSPQSHVERLIALYRSLIQGNVNPAVPAAGIESGGERSS